MIKTLLAIRFRAFLSAIGGKNKQGQQKTVSKGKVILMGVLYLYLAVCIGALSAMNAYAVSAAVVGTEIEWLFFSLFTVLPFFIILLFSIFEMKTEIFECRDNDILIPLPIPARAIVLSRVLTVLIYNYIESAVIILPALVAYLVAGGSALYFFGGLLISLFVPLLATAISTAIGYAVAVLASHMKHKNLATLLISLLFLLGYFYFYSQMMSGEAYMTNALVSVLPILEQYKALRFLGESAMWNPLATVGVILLSVGAFALAYYFISRNFLRLVTREKSVKHAYKEKKETQKSPFLSLCGKEFRRFASSAGYMLNASMGIIMTVVVTVLLFSKRDSLPTLMETLELQSGLYPVVLMLLVGIGSMTSISASSVSLEGKNLWLLRSLPIPSKTVLLAKAVPHFLLSAPVGVVCALAAAALVPDVSVLDCLFAVLLPLSASLALSLLGVAVNVWLPKFDWVNEMAVVKRATPVMIFTLAPMLLTFLLVAGTFFLTLVGLGFLGVIFAFALYSGVAVAACFLVVGPCAAKFDTFS